MNASVFVDTNVQVYLFDADAPVKQQRARCWHPEIAW
jgi:predicted nucleic acid-binding protein